MLEITYHELELLDEAFHSPARPDDSLLEGLLDAAVREYRHLRIGLRESTSMVAWACRNLLELNIYTQYVLSSEANARRFTGEHLTDGIEIFDAFQTWAARNDPALVTPEITSVLAELVDQSRKRKPPHRCFCRTGGFGPQAAFSQSPVRSFVTCFRCVEDHPSATSLPAIVL